MIEKLFDLRGRVAIVTGGSRGLGAEFAEGLAEAGASLMLCARRDEWLIPGVEALRARGFTAHAMRCDVSNPTEVQGVVDATVERFGTIDILVNNAGVSWAERPEAMTLAQWQKVIDINLTGAFICSQAVGREMLKRQYGRIINIASIAGFQGNANGPYYAGYAASKAGLMGLTRELAASWGRHGIRVNAIAPGFFPSKMTQGSLERISGEVIAASPLKRLGGDEDLKGLAVLLASDASQHITGQIVAVDGGATAV